MTTQSLCQKRVFVVDDNPANMFVMSSLLKKAGAETSYERWGTTTLQRMRAFAPIDLVLMDLMFPGTSGYELFDLIHAEPDFADIPIVAVSAGDPASALPKVQAKGFVAFIAKPIDYDHFDQQILKILNNEAVWVF